MHVRAEHRISLRVGDPVHGLQMHYLHPDQLCPATAHACAADAAADAGSTHTVARHFGVVSDVTETERHMKLRAIVPWGDSATLEKWEEVLGVARATAIERISKTTTDSNGVVGRKVRKLFTKRVQQKKIKKSYAGNNP